MLYFFCMEELFRLVEQFTDGEKTNQGGNKCDSFRESYCTKREAIYSFCRVNPNGGGEYAEAGHYEPLTDTFAADSGDDTQSKYSQHKVVSGIEF